MRKIQFSALAVISVAIFVGTATAQRKAPRKPVRKKPPVTKIVLPVLDVRVGREKVDNQLENINRFVDLLGPIAIGIESLDASNKTKRLPQATIAKNEANKEKVIEAIRNLKAGLATLESDFRTKPALQRYLTNIQGITDLAAQSEDSAIAGKFVAAKDPLRAAAEKLTDTLAVIPR